MGKEVLTEVEVGLGALRTFCRWVGKGVPTEMTSRILLQMSWLAGPATLCAGGCSAALSVRGWRLYCPSATGGLAGRWRGGGGRQRGGG